MLFEMLTGTLPFKTTDSIAALMQSILNDQMPDVAELRPELPTALMDGPYQSHADQGLGCTNSELSTHWRGIGVVAGGETDWAIEDAQL